MASFWPDQVLKDAVACLAVLAVVMFLTIWPGLRSEQGYRARCRRATQETAGARSSCAPADGATPYSAARPEWYFLFLFQFLKLFQVTARRGSWSAAIVVPGAVMLLLVFDAAAWARWKLGHRFNVGVLGCLLVGVDVC